MRQPINGVIDTADITVDMDGTRQIEARLDDGSPILLRRLFIHMEKDGDGQWARPEVTGSAARRSVRTGGWRKAYYTVDGIVMDDRLTRTVDEAVRKVKEDAATREAAA